MSNTKKVVLSDGAEVVLRELTFGEENDATRRAIEEAQARGSNNIDIVTKKEYLLLESLESAPWPKTLGALRNVPRKDGLALWEAYRELNEVVPGELTNSGSAKPRTGGLPEKSGDGIPR